MSDYNLEVELKRSKALTREVYDLRQQLATSRDAALVEAAKAMCPVCNDGYGVTYDASSSVFRHIYSYRCDASEIHRLRQAKEGKEEQR